MKHIFFIVHIFAFILGFLSISLSFIIYKQNKTSNVKAYCKFMLALTLVLFEQTITSYINVNKINDMYIRVILIILSSIGCAMTIYYTPAFLHEFLGIVMGKRLRYFIQILSCIPLINGGLYYVLPWPSMVISISNLALMISIVYTVFLTIHHLKDLSSYKRNIVNVFALLTIIALPFIFLDIILERIPGIGVDFPYGILALPVYYAAWNAFSLYFGFHEFGHMIDSKNLSKEKDN
jgi:hypothetical protein